MYDNKRMQAQGESIVQLAGSTREMEKWYLYLWSKLQRTCPAYLLYAVAKAQQTYLPQLLADLYTGLKFDRLSLLLPWDSRL